MRPILTLALLLFGCGVKHKDDTAYSGFLCGTSYDSSQDTQGICSRPHELCACDSNSCIRATSDCDTGYVYVDFPFARRQLAGLCVSELSLTTAIAQSGAARSCPAETAPIDAGTNPGDAP